MIRGGGTGTARTAIAVPKLKQVVLSRTKTGVETAARPGTAGGYFVGMPHSICARAVVSGIIYIGVRFSIIRGRGQKFLRARAVNQSNN